MSLFFWIIIILALLAAVALLISLGIVIHAAFTASKNHRASHDSLERIERKMLSVAAETDDYVQRIDAFVDGLQSDQFAPKKDAIRSVLSTDSELQVSDEYLDLCIDVLKRLWDDGIRFVDLQQELQILQSRRYAEVWLFLNKPLNSPGSGIYYNYLADMVSHNTRVFMFVPPEELTIAANIDRTIADEVGHHAAELFEYPLQGAHSLLPANLVVFRLADDEVRAYSVIIGQDGYTLVAYRLPDSEHTTALVSRANRIVQEQRQLNDQIESENREHEHEEDLSHDDDQSQPEDNSGP